MSALARRSFGTVGCGLGYRGAALARDPLAGCSVLDLTRVVAGPFCTQLLGDLGARVLKVERPAGGDETRRWGPPYVAASDLSCYFVSLNRNKMSLCVDLKTPQGISIIHDLAKKCDILVENFVPGKLDELGLGYEKLKKIAPHLIYCSITGFGPDGPYSKRPGYDVIATGYGGLLSVTGDEGGGPVKPGVAMTDVATGLHAYGSIMAAMLLRGRTGEGQKIDCNLLSTQVSSLINLGSNYLNAGEIPGRLGTAHASIVPYQAFHTKDSYVIVGTGSDEQFRSLCAILNVEHIPDDEKFSSNKMRVKNRKELLTLLESIFSTKTTDEWLRLLEGSPFPHGPINDFDKVFEDEHIRSMNLVEELDHPTAGKIKIVGPPTKFSDGGNRIRMRPPLLGEHTDETLIDVLGYDREKDSQPSTIAVLTLRKPRVAKKVEWSNDTVDNENMNKKKSKCCCIYKKKKEFGESDSEDSGDECDNCFGHVERRKKQPKPSGSPDNQDPT